MTTDEKRFIIDQLRKDKIIYATEACATVLVSILAFQFSNQHLSGSLRDIVNVFSFVLAVGYTIFMGVGNYFRLMEIQKLEKTL
jgi:hypothetical protein